MSKFSFRPGVIESLTIAHDPFGWKALKFCREVTSIISGKLGLSSSFLKPFVFRKVAYFSCILTLYSFSWTDVLFICPVWSSCANPGVVIIASSIFHCEVLSLQVSRFPWVSLGLEFIVQAFILEVLKGGRACRIRNTVNFPQ